RRNPSGRSLPSPARRSGSSALETIAAAGPAAAPDLLGPVVPAPRLLFLAELPVGEAEVVGRLDALRHQLGGTRQEGDRGGGTAAFQPEAPECEPGGGAVGAAPQRPPPRAPGFVGVAGLLVRAAEVVHQSRVVMLGQGSDQVVARPSRLT